MTPELMKSIHRTETEKYKPKSYSDDTAITFLAVATGIAICCQCIEQ